VARLYYKSICQAVKAVDPDRRIFRNGFDGNKDIPNSVLDEMKGHPDVLSVQHFL
jgi:hypothetical protein